MKIDLYTDGSCMGNPGPGGWAFLLRITEKTGSAGKVKETRRHGGEPYTTNNRMEMLAVIEGLRVIHEKFPKITAAETIDDAPDIEIHSDSSLVIKTMTDNWKRKKNLDLWEELTPLVMGLDISWKWVKGHAGNTENEDCDVRAQLEARKQEKLVRANPDLAQPPPEAQGELFNL